MGEQRMVPVNMGHEELIAVLEDILTRVREGDSFEGSIEYMLPDPDDAPQHPDGFDVRASYRIGNSMGQGGMRMYGQWVDVPDQPR